MKSTTAALAGAIGAMIVASVLISPLLAFESVRVSDYLSMLAAAAPIWALAGAVFGYRLRISGTPQAW